MPPIIMVFGLLAQFLVLIYPMLIMHAKTMNPTSVILLLTPWIISFVVYSAIPEWTTLQSFSDILENAGKGDVIFRFIMLGFFLFYVIILFLIPYNNRKAEVTPTNHYFYAFGVLLATTLHFLCFLTGLLIFHLLHQLWLGSFFYLVTIFELEERMIKSDKGQYTQDRPAMVSVGEDPDTFRRDPAKVTPAETAPKETVPEEAATNVKVNPMTNSPKESMSKPLWDRICHVLDELEYWRQSDFTVDALARECGSNVTYVTNCVKENTGYGCNEYINRKRIDFVCKSLDNDPGANLMDVFFEAGYRSRTTAWRNFRDLVGVSPSEYKLTKK